MFKKLFLPVGMLVAVALAFIVPEPGIWFKSLKLNNWLIIAIFLVCGWQTTADLKFDRKFLLVFVTGALITLIAAPFAGWGIAKGFHLDPLSAAGLMVIAAMPPTLSSGVVMTGTAGGNTLLAMTVTIGYSFIGVFILPVILPLVLPEGTEIVVKPGKMLLDLALLVILPAVAGVGLRLLTKKKLPAWGGHIPSLCVILLVWGFDLHDRWHIKYMGDNVLDKGFPPISMPSFKYLGKLIPQGIVISIIAFVITISAGKTFSRKVYY